MCWQLYFLYIIIINTTRHIKPSNCLLRRTRSSFARGLSFTHNGVVGWQSEFSIHVRNSVSNREENGASWLRMAVTEPIRTSHTIDWLNKSRYVLFPHGMLGTMYGFSCWRYREKHTVSLPRHTLYVSGGIRKLSYLCNVAR